MSRRAILLLLTAAGSYLAGGYLVWRYSATDVRLRVDRAHAIRIARQVAVAHEPRAAAWPAAAKLQSDEVLRRYQALHPDGPAAALGMLVPDLYWNVLLAPPGRSEGFEVHVDRAGAVTAYRRFLPPDFRAPDGTDSAAAATARQTMNAMFGSAASQFTPAGSERESTANGPARTYTFRRSIPSRPEASVTATVRVIGGEPAAITRSVALNADYLRRNPRMKAPAQTTTAFVITTIVSALFFYGLFRFVQRARQREVPYGRALLLAAATAAGLITLTFVATDHSWTHEAGSELSSVMEHVVTEVLGLFVVGLVVFVAWGACEGDVRELFPGKLTSLDALLGGRIASRNVARSFLLGAALGGYSLLASGLVGLLISLSPQRYAPLTELITQLENRSILLYVLSAAAGPAPLLVGGLLVPISLLSRWFRRPPRVLLVLLIAFTAVALIIGAATTTVPYWTATAIAVHSLLFMLLAFYAADLLAVLFMTATSLWVSAAAFHFAQISPGFHTRAIAVLAVFLLVTAAAAIALRRGREWSEEQVRPLYARYIADRLRLEAQLTAARAAQLTMMPPRAPRVAGVTIAAECRPAHEVSGDYYDFFPLHDDRLALIFADCKGEKLSAALSVAMLKGLLLTYVRTDPEPARITTRVSRHLRTVLGEGLPFSFIYGVLDAGNGVFTFSRVGPTPYVVHVSGNGTPRGEVLDGDTADRAVRLGPDDSVVLFSDGLAEARSESGIPVGVDHLVDALRNSTRDANDAQSLLQALFRSADRGGIDAQSWSDDRTAIVIRPQRGAPA